MYRESERPPLDESVPIVSMDIDMGKKFSNIDFDYETFMWRAVALHDMADKDIAALSINIKPHPFIGFSGRYRFNEITVTENEQQGANHTLQHELQHAADDSRDLLDADRRLMAGNLAMPSSAILIAIGASAYLNAEIYNARLPAHSGEVLGGAALLASSFAIWGYVLHPSEVRARKAGKAKNQDIIIMEKHSRSTKLRRLGNKLINSPIGGAGIFTIGTAEIFQQSVEH